MRWTSALVATVLIAAAAPTAALAQSTSPDLSAYDCARVGDGTSALIARHVLQYVEGQFVEWDEYLTRENTPHLVCVQQLRPTPGALSAAAAKELLTASVRVGAPTAAAGVERMQAGTAASDGKFRDAPAMPLPKATEPAAGVERSQSFDPDAMSPASKRYDGAPQASSSSSFSGAVETQALQEAGIERNAAGVERQLTFGVDDRTRVSTSTSPTYPYNTIGYLSVTYPSGGRFRCSGVLVSPYVVLTAGHCVHNNDRGGFIASATFYPAQNEASATSPTLRPNGGKSDLKWVRTTSRWTQISGPDTHLTSDYQYDLAAIEFATPFTYTSTFMPIAFSATSTTGYNVGYPAYTGPGSADDTGTFTEGQWFSSGADVSTNGQRSIGIKEYRIDATGGQSGSPFYGVDNRLIGILSYGQDLDDRAGGPWYSSNNQTIVSGWAAWTPASDSTDSGTTASGNSVSGLRVSGIYDTSNTANLSFLRFYNTGVSANTVDVTLANPDDGSLMATWTSPSIPAGASLQVDVGTIERNVTGGKLTKGGYYVASIRPRFNGYFQHVMWRPAEGTLSNLTMCDTKLTNDPTRLMNVHSSRFSATYPARIVIHNTGTTTAAAILGVYDAVTGSKLGSYSTGSMPPNAEVVRSADQIEAGMGFAPNASQGHYNIRLDASFTGTLAYRMTNATVNDTLDMTAVCTLAAQ